MSVSREDIREAIRLLGGPSGMARIWNINVRNAGRYYSGTRELPPKRLAQLILALRAKAREASVLADQIRTADGPVPAAAGPAAS